MTKSKFLPVSQEALEDIHYRGGKDAVALYFRINLDSHFFSGKGLILGRQPQPESELQPQSGRRFVGHLDSKCKSLVNFIRVPSKKIALMSEWETKIEAIANSTISGKCNQPFRCSIVDASAYQTDSRKDRKTDFRRGMAEFGSIFPWRSGLHTLP